MMNNTEDIASQSKSPLTLATLPDDVLRLVLPHLDDRALVNLGAAARRFRELSNEPLLWKHICRSQFRYWNDREAFLQSQRNVASQDWKGLYVRRCDSSQTTKKILEGIIKHPRGRSDKIYHVVAQGYEAKDLLLKLFRDSPASPNHLAQRYWSHVVIGCLHRSEALKQWIDIKYGNVKNNLTERSLAAFDMFILDQQERGDIDDTFDRLNHYVAAIRLACPDLDEQTPRTKAITIAAYIRDRHWVGLSQGRDYYCLDNMFLGVALFSSHNNSIPLVTSVIYSYIVRQFGLQAQPINYPMHVHVLVQPPPDIDIDGNSLNQSTTLEPFSPLTHLYMDPFNTIEPIPNSTLQAHLRFATQPMSRSANIYLSAATHRDLLYRSAGNIRNTCTRHSSSSSSLTHPIRTESALYAALFAFVFFPKDPDSLRRDLTDLTQHFLQHFDYDLRLFTTYILPQTINLPDHLTYRNLSLQLLRNDLKDPTPKLRSTNPSTNRVNYRVGQIFRHRRRHYTALIYGWDATCEMTHQWIAMNQVDNLPRGRDQPFYNVLVIEDRSTRYVAEENVVLLGPKEHGGNGEMVSMEEVEGWPIEIGKWMKRFEVNEEGLGWRFVSNVRDEYPED